MRRSEHHSDDETRGGPIVAINSSNDVFGNRCVSKVENAITLYFVP